MDDAKGDLNDAHDGDRGRQPASATRCLLRIDNTPMRSERRRVDSMMLLWIGLFYLAAGSRCHG